MQQYGWIKYKPLLLYIKDRENYETEIKEAQRKLEEIVPKFNEIFGDTDFSVLLEELKKYHDEVEEHDKAYKKTNEIWNHLKMKINNAGD